MVCVHICVCIARVYTVCVKEHTVKGRGKLAKFIVFLLIPCGCQGLNLGQTWRHPHLMSHINCPHLTCKDV